MVIFVKSLFLFWLGILFHQLGTGLRMEGSFLAEFCCFSSCLLVRLWTRIVCSRLEGFSTEDCRSLYPWVGELGPMWVVSEHGLCRRFALKECSVVLCAVEWSCRVLLEIQEWRARGGCWSNDTTAATIGGQQSLYPEHGSVSCCIVWDCDGLSSLSSLQKPLRLLTAV